MLVIDVDTQAGQTTFLGDRRQPDSDTDTGAVMMGTCDLDDAVVTDVYPDLDVQSSLTAAATRRRNNCTPSTAERDSRPCSTTPDGTGT